MIKKICIILLINFICIPVLAGGIGYIDYEKIINNYKFAEVTKQELDMKSEELKKFLEQKEEEYKLLESPVQKSKFEAQMHEEVIKRENAFNDFVKKREEAVKKRIFSAVEQVRVQKEFDAVLDKESIYSGGTDMTNEVLELLNL